MSSSFPELFRPGRIGKLRVSNRIVMAPMFTNFAHINGEVSEALLAHYSARAQGGVGTVVVEAACVSPNLTNQGPGQLHISHPRYIPGLSRLNDAIKAYGSCTFIQLVHPGRQTSSLHCGGQPVAPTALPCPIMQEVPRPLEEQELQQIISDFVQAAHHARQAGFDGVELHAAHGYLINQFLSPRTNRRDDRYGGTLTNRQRFLLEIVRGIRSQEPELIISVRLNIEDFLEGGFGMPESLEVCRTLELAGVDIIHCSSGTYESGLKSVEPAAYLEGWRVYLAEAVKQVVSIPVITGGMIRNPEFANAVLDEGRADFVFLGRPLLADPEWPAKVRRGDVADIRPCINCNYCIENEFAGLGVRCAVNPVTGRERAFDLCSGNRASARVVVVGGGPAGMQAALSLRRHGLEVILVEKEASLGGFLHLAAVPPHKSRLGLLAAYLRYQVRKCGAEVRLGTTAGKDLLAQLNPDAVVVATGSRPKHPDVECHPAAFCMEAVEVLAGQKTVEAEDVLIIGGGRTGCEVAAFLAGPGKRIVICEKGSALAADMERKNRRALLNSLAEAGVVRRTGMKVLAIEPGQVKISSEQGQEVLPAQCVVWACGFYPQDDLYQSLASGSVPVSIIGDAAGVRGIKDAILEGERSGVIIRGILSRPEVTSI